MGGIASNVEPPLLEPYLFLNQHQIDLPKKKCAGKNVEIMLPSLLKFLAAPLPALVVRWRKSGHWFWAPPPIPL